jgi:hypothetical protein
VGTLFIGGGPATLGVFAHAYQIGRYVLYLYFYHQFILFRTREIAEEFAVIEASTSETFGGGNLVNYFGIRSNTSASGFLKVISYPKGSKKDGSAAQPPKDYINSGSNKQHNQIIFGGGGARRSAPGVTSKEDTDDDSNSEAKIMPTFN